MENNQKRKVAFIPLFLSLCILLLSIGYASINSITGEIKGTLVANKQDGVFITDVVYDSSMNAIESDSSINNYYKTTLNSSIVLSNVASDSAITYKITVYNSMDYVYKFNNVLYGEEFYDNSNIVFELTGLNQGDEIVGKGYISFYVTFSYLDDVVSTNNILNSYLNFDFVKTGDFPTTTEGLEVEFEYVYSWGGEPTYYYQYNILVTNTTDSVIDGWQLVVPVPSGSKMNVWGVEYEATDEYIILTPVDYGKKIEPGATYTGGGGQFIVSDGNFVPTTI